MFTIPLKAIPNQRLNVRLEGEVFDITIKEAFGTMLFSLCRQGIAVVRGVPCVPEMFLAPYGYLEGGKGNFFFTTVNGVYPHYSRFAANDVLHYATAHEVAGLRRKQ